MGSACMQGQLMVSVDHFLPKRSNPSCVQAFFAIITLTINQVFLKKSKTTGLVMSAKLLGLSSVFASVAFLLACGGGGGSGGSSGGGSDDDVTQSAIVTGVAAKGILIGAPVRACADMECRDIVSETVTDRNGRYHLSLPVDEDFVISVRSSSDATMVCDFPSCEADFGRLVDMPSDIRLRSIARVDRTSREVSAHITPLTELVMIAAQLSNAGAAIPPPREAIQKGEQAVVDLLGIGGEPMLSLTQLEPVDITGRESMERGTDLQKRISVIAAAFGERDGAAPSLSELGKALSSNTITAETRKVLDDLASSVVELSKKTQVHVAINPSLEISPVEQTAPTANQRELLSSNALAVRDLINDIRTVGIEIYNQYQDEDRLQSGLIGQVQSLEDFAQDAVIWNFDAITEVIAVVGKAFIEEYSNNPECALQCDDLPILFDLQDDLGAGPDISGTLNRSGNNWTLTNGVVNIENQGAVKVALELTAPKILGKRLFDFEGFSVRSEGLNTVLNLFDVNLVGVFEKPISENQIQSGIVAGDDGSFLRRVELDAKLKMKYSDHEDSLEFQGGVEFLAATNENMVRENSSNPEEFLDRLLPVSLGLDGRFESGNLGKFIEAGISVTLDNADEYFFIQDQAKDRFEDDDRFPLATIELTTAGRISSALPEMDVFLRIQRTDKERANAQFILGWDGFSDQTDRRFLELEVGYEGDVDELILTATNPSGATFKIQPRSQETSDDVVGHVFIDGVRHATIREERSNLFIITYHFDENGRPADTEEEFETLF